MTYRREIDGLRALAILPVILFHAGFPAFGGGFVGVDIFFVISGYLITSAMIAEKQKGTFTLAGFYERRARRILPALFLVMFVCLPFAWCWLPPSDLKQFSQSLVAVSVFSSNFLFYLTSGYFDPASDLKPLLHTWSLALEEQYYLLFPLFLLLAWRLGKRRMAGTMVVLAALSLALAEWSAFREPAAAFYLLPARVWEFLIGALVACYPFPIQNVARKSGLSQIGSVIGLVLIAYAVFAFDDQTPVPGLYSLIPTLGTALVICCATDGTIVGRLLGSKPLVGIGLISYSAYLWHQPVFAFVRQHSLDQPSQLVRGAASAATLLLACLSWKYVETPFRNKALVARKAICYWGGGCSCVFVLIGLAGHFNDGYAAARLNEQQVRLSLTAIASPKRTECHTGGLDYKKPSGACEYFGADIRWAVLGDSHVVELGYSLAEKLKEDNIGLKHLSFSGCYPSFEDEHDSSACAQWTKAAVANLENDRRIHTVVVSYRLTQYLSGRAAGSDLQDPVARPEEDNSLRWKSYLGVLEALNRSGKTVIAVLQSPEVGRDVNDLIFRFGRSGDDIVGVSRKWWDERNSYVQQRKGEIPANVVVIDPTALFCDANNCFAVKNGVSLYFDDNHLSIAGARLVVGEIMKRKIDWP